MADLNEEDVYPENERAIINYAASACAAAMAEVAAEAEDVDKTERAVAAWLGRGELGGDRERMFDDET
jgi:Xaa-Pro aminopeptidase